MTAWACPLCDYRTAGDDVLPSVIRHATSQHPAYLPERQTTADMLDGLPALIREAIATIGAPNPDGRPGRGSRRAGWQPPVELWTIDALRPDDGAEGHSSALITRLTECSRLIWEAMDPAGRQTHPQPVGTPKWGTEIDWLRQVWPHDQAWLDPADYAWIDDELKAIHATLAALCRLRRRPRYLCPTGGCREPMHLGDDDWLTCGAGHQHPGPVRLEREWRRKPPMPTRDLCEALRVPEGTMYRWHHEKRIKPTRQEGRAMWWLPWDVIALRYPDIVAAIDERDTEAA